MGIWSQGDWFSQLLLAVVGLSAGMIVASGIFAFIIGLGIISDFADRTHTGKHILLYEDAVALGGILGNILYVFFLAFVGNQSGESRILTMLPESGLWILSERLRNVGGQILLGIFGLLAGVFTGAWAMALAEMLNVFPIFVRRIRLVKCIPWAILGMALGRCAGALLFFWRGWGR